MLGGYNLDGGSMFVPMVVLAIPDIHGRPSDYNSFLTITSRVYPFNVTSAKLVADYYYNNQRNKGEKYGKELVQTITFYSGPTPEPGFCLRYRELSM